jgi:Flp pilus assembly pilin Flp
MTHMPTIFGQLVADEGGASVVELGLCAPLFAAFVIGITDVAMGYQQKLRIEQAAFRSLEQVQVGMPQSSYAFVQAEAAAAASVPASQVAVAHWRQCNETVQASVPGACPSGQERQIYVRVTINSSYTPMFDYGVLPTVNGSVPIVASASVRVE